MSTLRGTLHEIDHGIYFEVDDGTVYQAVSYEEVDLATVSPDEFARILFVHRCKEAGANVRQARADRRERERKARNARWIARRERARDVLSPAAFARWQARNNPTTIMHGILRDVWSGANRQMFGPSILFDKLEKESSEIEGRTATFPIQRKDDA